MSAVLACGQRIAGKRDPLAFVHTVLVCKNPRICAAFQRHFHGARYPGITLIRRTVIGRRNLYKRGLCTVYRDAVACDHRGSIACAVNGTNFGKSFEIGCFYGRICRIIIAPSRVCVRIRIVPAVFNSLHARNAFVRRLGGQNNRFIKEFSVSQVIEPPRKAAGILMLNVHSGDCRRNFIDVFDLHGLFTDKSVACC